MDIRNLMKQAIPVVESLYDRVATVKRYVDYEKPNGSTGKRWEAVHENVPCRLSTAGIQTLSNSFEEDVNHIQYDAKLFLSTDYKILAGDEVIVQIIEDEILIHSDEFEKAKEPFIYSTHQEVLIKRKAYA